MTTPKVYFFSTCLIEHIEPQIGLDAVELLGYCGVECVFPEHQACCAQPAFNSGEKDEAVRVATKTVELLCKEGIPIVVPSASCADMLKHHLPRLFNGDASLHDNAILDNALHNKALDISKRSVELLDFLIEHLPQLPATGEKITLHLSCASLRGSNSHKAWQAIVEKAGYEVAFPDYVNECCGFGGTFSVKAPEISSVMAEDKCKHLQATGNQQYYSGDLGCLMHLNGFSNKQGLKLQGSHIATLLRERYGKDDEVNKP